MFLFHYLFYSDSCEFLYSFIAMSLLSYSSTITRLLLKKKNIYSFMYVVCKKPQLSTPSTSKAYSYRSTFDNLELLKDGLSSMHGVEYAFGAHKYSISGVFEVEPRQRPGFKFRKSVCMGTTCLDPQVREFM
jgi:hypothetical protein